MKYWILGGVLLILIGLYFGVTWVQALGVGLIALPFLIIGLLLVFFLLIFLVAIILGSVAVFRFKQAREKRKR